MKFTRRASENPEYKSTASLVPAETTFNQSYFYLGATRCFTTSLSNDFPTFIISFFLVPVLIIDLDILIHIFRKGEALI
jgi:hypothetical protein